MILQQPIELANPFEGINRAKVIRNDDPNKEGRIGLLLPKLHKNLDFEATEEIKDVEIVVDSPFHDLSEERPSGQIEHVNYIWARSSDLMEDSALNDNIGGRFKVPAVGSWVFMFFEENDPRKPRYLPLSPRGIRNIVNMDSLLDSGETKTDETKLPNIEVIASYPNGTTISYDHNPEVNSFLVSFKDGHVLRIRDDGAENKIIELKTRNGNYINMNDVDDTLNIFIIGDVNTTVEEGDVNLNVNTGNVNANIAGDTSLETGGNMAVAVGGNATVDVSGRTNVTSGGDVTVKAPTIRLN